MHWDEPQSGRCVATFHRCCFFPASYCFGPTHLQWTRNYRMLPEHGPCVLRHLRVASTHALWVTNPALQVLAGLFMRGLGGLARAQSVRHVPMENHLPTPASFLWTGKCRGKLFSARYLAALLAQPRVHPGSLRSWPSTSWQMLPLEEIQRRVCLWSRPSF